MSSELKPRFLDAGRVLFIERPFHKVSVEQICDRAALGNGSFFHTCKSKPAFAADIYRNACRHRDHEIIAALNTAPDAQVGIKAAVARLLHFLSSDQPEARLLRHLRDGVADEPGLKGDRDGLAALSAALAGWIERMVAAHQIASISPMLLAVLLVGPARAVAELGSTAQAGGAKEMTDPLADRLWAALQAADAAAPVSRARTSSRVQPSRPRPEQPKLI